MAPLPGHPPALPAADQPATVAIVGNDISCRQLQPLLQSGAVAGGGALSTVTISRGGASASSPLADEMELLIVRVETRDLACLGWALTEHHRLGRPELLFLVDSLLDPAAVSLAQLGLSPIVPCSDDAGDVAAVAGLLIQICRGRRAKERLPDVMKRSEAPPHAAMDARGGLFTAEQAFRETYVRALLVSSDSRRQAAERAGVPYRTFCQIAASLGITAPASPGKSTSSTKTAGLAAVPTPTTAT
jgi:hypothetical protein